MNLPVDLEAFRTEWLEEVVSGNPSTIELGRRFARKLISQWLDVNEFSDDIVYCDGSGDGGIDIACLSRGESVDESIEEGDTWYLVQSKYGKFLHGTETLLMEAQKIFDTLDGRRNNLSSVSQDVLERLVSFREKASERDKLILVFATERSLNENEKRALEDIRTLGISRLGSIFDVESISIETIYQRVLESRTTKVKISVKAQDNGDKLLVGSIKLLELFNFMKSYRDETGDLDQLYEKNVRRFLGTRRKVNAAIKRTLEQEPESFGLYNNGVTIVVEDFQKNPKRAGYELVEPYIVNGCQTTKTIWNVLFKKLESGGTGSSKAFEEWKEKASKGVVIVKIVKVGSEGEKLLTDITRYTNSQNTVSEKDFIALTSDFRAWAKEIGDKYNIFLEIQRGGWDSRRAWEKQNPNSPQFKEWVNAFDLFKVYGAGWLGEVGLAFGKNPPFLPSGSIFKKIMNNPDGGVFGIDDLYAAYSLQKASNEYQFGREAPKLTRRSTRFLFYRIVIELLETVMTDAQIDRTSNNITEALLKLFKTENELASKAIMDTAIELIDEYMTPGKADSVFNEPEYIKRQVKNVNDYIQWEYFGKSQETSPKLIGLLEIHKRTIKRRTGGQQSPFELVLEAIKRCD
ncbi:AIPR family protein [Coleofasciculus sp. FACHB-129]|uniref:AIPR family protein n=1 Tax=Cyanophyceae TaxID=3028117 RepID=UPI001686F083|nr:AIPR family protein [Coleofasciculus sp. FACHB-129]MBD1895917.1 AIPR family protein [Coleofasciculus sp. FACHB-129]